MLTRDIGRSVNLITLPRHTQACSLLFVVVQNIADPLLKRLSVRVRARMFWVTERVSSHVILFGGRCRDPCEERRGSEGGMCVRVTRDPKGREFEGLWGKWGGGRARLPAYPLLLRHGKTRNDTPDPSLKRRTTSRDGGMGGVVMSSQSGCQEVTQLVLVVHSNISLDVPFKSPSLLFLSTLSSSSTPGRPSPFNRRRSRSAFHQVSSSAIGGSNSLDRNLARRPSYKNNSADL